MPELNPLSNEQIFLKKIAENTGSNYNTGDVSEINPLTIDQILLREIAANTAGQAGDISELVEKVTDLSDTMAANGAHNLLPFPGLSDLKAINTLGTWNNNVYSYYGATFTVDETNKTISIEKAAQSGSGNALIYLAKNIDFGNTVIATISSTPQTANGWTISDGNDIAAKTVRYGVAYDTNGNDVYTFIGGDQVLPSSVIIKPMIRLATDPSTEYTPYAMTNRELTVKTVTETITANANSWLSFPVGRTILNAYIANTYNKIILTQEFADGKYIGRWFVDINDFTFTPALLTANTDYSITYQYIG